MCAGALYGGGACSPHVLQLSTRRKRNAKLSRTTERVGRGPDRKTVNCTDRAKHASVNHSRRRRRLETKSMCRIAAGAHCIAASTRRSDPVCRRTRGDRCARTSVHCARPGKRPRPGHALPDRRGKRYRRAVASSRRTRRRRVYFKRRPCVFQKTCTRSSGWFVVVMTS